MTDSSLRLLFTAEDRASGVVSRLRGELSGLQRDAGALGRGLSLALAPLAAGFSVAGITAWAKSTAEGIDKLNDLKDASGESIAMLSALEDVALRNGHSFDVASDALVKLNKSLFDAADNPDSDPGRAIQALGLNVKELLALSPVERMQALAVALNGFGDENKLQYNLALFGRSARDLVPLLNDLAAAGKLAGTVTDEDAEAADRFGKELAALSKDVADVSRSLVGPLLSALNQTIDKFREGAKEGKSFYRVIYEEQMKLLGLGKLVGAQPAASTGGATGSWGEPDKPSLPPLPAAADKPARAAVGRAQAQQIDEASQALASYVAGLSRALEAEKNLSAEQEAQSFLKSIGKTGEVEQVRELVLGLAAEKDMRAELAAQARLAADASKALLSQQLADQARLNQLLAATPSGQEAERLKNVLFINKAFDDGLISLGQWNELTEQLDDHIEKAGKTAKDVGDEIGLVFASAAGEAITHWQGVDDLLKGILQDLAQIALRQMVMKPLSGMVSGALEGLNLGSLFGVSFGHGGAFDTGGIRRFATGDVFGSPTLFRYGGGRVGLMGEAGPEAIMPLKRGADGKLGVAAGGGSSQVNVAINVAPGAAADDWRRSKRAIAADLQRGLRRAGAIA